MKVACLELLTIVIFARSWRANQQQSQEPSSGRARTAQGQRLFWAGPLTVIASVVTVLFIRIIAVAILKPDPKFEPLTVGPPTFDTVVAATCAVLVFLANARYSLEPVRDYRALAAKVLIVSFVPDIALAVLHGFGGGWPEALALMVMHVAVWAICVTLLPALTMTGGGPDSATPSLPHNRYGKG